MELRTMYMHQEQDLDYSYYWVINADVQLYRGQNSKINAIFKRFKKREKQRLYIKGNRLFFTLNGVKYYEILSCSSWEWEHIQEINQELEKEACFICYYPGELD